MQLTDREWLQLLKLVREMNTRLHAIESALLDSNKSPDAMFEQINIAYRHAVGTVAHMDRWQIDRLIDEIINKKQYSLKDVIDKEGPLA